MKKLILGSVALLIATAVLADVPRGRPGRGDGNNGGPVERTPISYVNYITGFDAEVLYKASNVAEKRNTLVRARNVVTYKVMRSANGLYQVVCVKTKSTVDRSGYVDYKCQTETSANGDEVPAYKPVTPRNG